MYGSFIGNITGMLYFLAFQFFGIYIICRIIKGENLHLKVLLGSVFGSVALQWLPLLFAFFFKFTLLSHILALLLLLIITAAVRFLSPPQKQEFPKLSFGDYSVLFLILPVYIYFVITLLNHTIPLKAGAMYAGQCTYGDMNMHLGFITSIANQGFFPPEYSILPGTLLAYPFLSDSISSSVYIFGASLRIAYVLPMLFAALQVFLLFFMFAYTWLKSRTKAALAWILFFINGGFGFIYFLDGLRENPEHFTRIFTSFYNTPTNLVDSNIRWVNVIVDMMIPQRASLFGWAVLFACLVMLYKAVYEKKKTFFYLAAVLAGALPMIHTHSFLALGIICAGWLFGQLLVSNIKRFKDNKTIHPGLVYFMVCITFLACFYAYGTKNPDIFKPTHFIILTALTLVVPMGYMLFLEYKKGIIKEYQGWGIFLLIVAVTAVPQLIFWTFKQSSGESFIRYHFNWGNQNDLTVWFYIKNIGIPAVLMLPALFAAKKNMLRVAFPAGLVWLLAELVVFQPNEYDNNKLLYPAFALLICVVAHYMVESYNKLKGLGGRRILAAIVLLLCTASGFLTMGREAVSEYQLYSKEQIQAAEYIESNTPTDSVILTDDRHNNAIASLTGRNIVCGAGTFLYFHGLDYNPRRQAAISMYSDPEENYKLFSKYKVDYIMIGPDERASYDALNEEAIQKLFPKVYQSDSVEFYAVSDRAKELQNGSGING